MYLINISNNNNNNTEDSEPEPWTDKPKLSQPSLPPIIHLDFRKKTVLFTRSRERQVSIHLFSEIVIIMIIIIIIIIIRKTVNHNH
jgi:hypothetical protein